MAKMPLLDPRRENCQHGRKSSGDGAFPVLLPLRGKGAMGDGIPDVLQSTTSLTASLSVVQIGKLSHFLDQ